MTDKQGASRRRFRFGIGEWYGRPFTELTPGERRRFAQIQLLSRDQRPQQLCPFLSSSALTVPCWKEGGVCSLRRYELSVDDSTVSVASTDGGLRTTCPSRFAEDNKIYRWIGEALLDEPAAVPIGQVNFLQRVPLMGATDTSQMSTAEVGRIDNVLVVPNSDPPQWCAVEIQAVYFSGARMELEFRALLETDDLLPFPAAHRRPDYRSSGPKRLMPQLQIKVPTLRRWGKKMAVVVDNHFFNAMGRMRRVDDLSNCDVAWFVVTYDHLYHLTRGEVYLTTLEESVDGLVAARPVSLQEFERRILARYSRLGSGPTEIPADD